MQKVLALFVLGAAVLLGACEGGESLKPETATAVASRVTYSRDTRTGLCFGSVASLTYTGYQVVAITTVPCERVEKFLTR